MQFEKGGIYHVFNQGNNQEKIFFSRNNYLFFLKKMRRHLLPYADIVCYCLMPNHFHWLIRVNEAGLVNSKSVILSKMGGDFKSPPIYQANLNQSIGIILSSYTRAINKQQNRTGSLFRKETKAKNGVIDGFISVDGKNKNLFFLPENNYARVCFDYIHRNPVDAGLVLKEIDWEFSSAKDYAGFRNGTLVNKKVHNLI